MVIEFMLDGLSQFVEYLLSLVPEIAPQADVSYIISSIQNGLAVLMRYGFAILPARCWDTFVVTVITVKVIQFAWVIIEWLYKKIPGVD